MKRTMKLENFILKNYKIVKVPISISNHHAHLTKQAVELLFGKNYKLKKRNNISQPGQYACDESIDVVAQKDRITCRVVGPCRDNTQVEISKTDAVKLGIKATLRLSGDIKNSSSAKLIGPKGEYVLKEGIVIVKMHMHLSDKEAKKFGLKNGSIVNLAVKTNRGFNIFGDLICRVDKNYRLDVHIDTDEANAAMIENNKGYIFY